MRPVTQHLRLEARLALHDKAGGSSRLLLLGRKQMLFASLEPLRCKRLTLQVPVDHMRCWRLLFAICDDIVTVAIEAVVFSFGVLQIIFVIV